MKDSNRIAVLDLQTGEIRKQLPSKVMNRRDYYRQRHAQEGEDEFILERAKAEKFESKLKTIIGKLCLGGQELTEDELILFIQHLELQHFTSPRQAKFLMSIGERFYTKKCLEIPKVAYPLRKGLLKIEMKDEFRFTALNILMKEGGIHNFLSRMIWEARDAPDGYSFITSDHPVTIFNPKITPSKIAGIGFVGSMLFFPLNSSHFLRLVHPEYIIETKIDPLTEIDAAPIDDCEVQIRAGAIMTPERVCEVNCLKALYAERNLVGSSIEILKEIYDSINAKNHIS